MLQPCCGAGCTGRLAAKSGTYVGAVHHFTCDTHRAFVLSLPPKRGTCSKHLLREGKPEGLPPTNQLNHFKCCLGDVAAAGLLPITSTTASLAICVSATNQAAGTEPPCGSNGPTASTAIRAQARRRRPQLLSNHPTALGGIKWSQAPAAARMGSLPPPHSPAADCAPGSGCCCAHGDLQLCCRHRSKHHFQTPGAMPANQHSTPSVQCSAHLCQRAVPALDMQRAATQRPHGRRQLARAGPCPAVGNLREGRTGGMSQNKCLHIDMVCVEACNTCCSWGLPTHQPSNTHTHTPTHLAHLCPKQAPQHSASQPAVSSATPPSEVCRAEKTYQG